MTTRALLLLALLAGCQKKDPAPALPGGGPDPGSGDTGVSLAEARKGFATKLAKKVRANEPVPQPPPTVFRKVAYPSPAGKLAAYLSPDPGDGKRRPAIVWVTGGD